MTGETDLDKLIRGMKPDLNAGQYVFCTLGPREVTPDLHPIGWFREPEGVTVILPKEQADELGFSYSYISAWITLTVHSALEAVGLTAAVSHALTQAGISCNIVAAYFHDHIFVPVDEAERALRVLQNLSEAAGSS